LKLFADLRGRMGWKLRFRMSAEAGVWRSWARY
jgi:hypothetical protein